VLEREAVDHAAVGDDRAGIEALAPDDDVHEVGGRLGHGGERAAARERELASAAADDVDDAALRGCAFVVVIVSGEREVDPALGEDRLDGPAAGARWICGDRTSRAGGA
jgi:hypothetical protein